MRNDVEEQKKGQKQEREPEKEKREGGNQEE